MRRLRYRQADKIQTAKLIKIKYRRFLYLPSQLHDNFFFSYFTFLVSLCILELPDGEWREHNEYHHRYYRCIIVFEQRNGKLVYPRDKNIRPACTRNCRICNSRISSRQEVNDSEIINIMCKAHDDERHCLIKDKWKSDVSKHLPPVCAVYSCCFKQILWNSSHRSH